MSRPAAITVATRTDSDRASPYTLVAVSLTVGTVLLRLVGVPRIDLHSPLHYLGIMDPRCGGTRAMYLLTSGDLAGAAHYNPVVFPLSLGAALLVVRAVIGWTTRRWLNVRLPIATRRVVGMVVLVLMLALWMRQQAMADLMMAPWPP